MMRYSLSGDGEYVVVGQANWLFWYVPDLPDARVQYRQNTRGRTEICGLYIDSDTPVTGYHLRALRIGRVENFLNVWRDKPVDLDFSPGVLERVEVLAAVKKLPLARFKAQSLLVPPHVRVGRGLPDSFYAGVAAVYDGLRLRGEWRCEQLIAEANGVPVSTVMRWLRVARRRGVMAPGRSRRMP